MGWVPHATRIHEVRLFPCPAWCRLHSCKACAQLAQLIIRSARDLLVQDHFHSSNFGRSVECGGSGGWAVVWGRTSSAPIAWQWEFNISHSFNLPLRPCLVSAIFVNHRDDSIIMSSSKLEGQTSMFTKYGVLTLGIQLSGFPYVWFSQKKNKLIAWLGTH